LRERLPSEHRVVVVERRATFSLGLSYLWIMAGERRDPSEGERDLAALADKGIEWVQDEVTRIDPESRAVETASGTLAGDYLIVALGAELAPGALAGFAEAAHNLYELPGALAIQQALDQLKSGRIVILITRTPFKCPAAPYEAAFLIDALLRRKGVREHVELAIYTPEPQPMPVAGADVGSQLVRMLEGHGIEYHPDEIALSIEPGSRRVLFELEETVFDLLIGVPPHVAPPIVRDAGLLDATGWVPVDARTLQTRHPGVFAIGDVTAIRLSNGMFLPKAGVFAEEEARVVAENIARDITGKDHAAEFSGAGYCYVETGDGAAALGAGDFYASPAPRVTLQSPSTRFKQEKEAFERTRLETWL
jgi:sulfide:quinone oxidoreductase